MELKGLNAALQALTITGQLYIYMFRAYSMKDFCCNYARGVVGLSDSISFYKLYNAEIENLIQN